MNDPLEFWAAVIAAEEERCPKCGKRLTKDKKVPWFKLICKFCGYKSPNPLK